MKFIAFTLDWMIMESDVTFIVASLHEPMSLVIKVSLLWANHISLPLSEYYEYLSINIY